MLNIEVNQTSEHYKAIKKITTRAEQIKRHAKEKVEIVRCRDCKYFNHKELECQCDGIVQDLADSASFRLNFYLDDYCSYGVRKDDTKIIGNKWDDPELLTRSKEHCNNVSDRFSRRIDNDRTEAIREFAEKLKALVNQKNYMLSDIHNSKDLGMFTLGFEQAIDEILEEMEK